VQQGLLGGPGGALERGARLAVASGVDPDTTAAVAGALLGALEGPGALPEAAWSLVHGGAWTGRRWSVGELAALAGDCVRAAQASGVDVAALAAVRQVGAVPVSVPLAQSGTNFELVLANDAHRAGSGEQEHDGCPK